MRRIAHTLALAALTLGLVGPVAAQVPPGQSCGGLLCDLGLFGQKVPVGPDGAAPSPAAMAAAEAADPHRLPCNDFLCRSFGGNREAEAAPAPPPPVAEPMTTEAVKPAKKKHHVKVAAKMTAPDAVKPDPAAH